MSRYFSTKGLINRFFGSNKGYLVSPQKFELNLNSEITYELRRMGRRLVKLQRKIDSQEKVIKALIKEIDK